jgi:hypothetical protein
MPGHPVALSYRMGADSTALPLRWIAEPLTRPCGLRDLLVVTAMTRLPQAFTLGHRRLNLTAYPEPPAGAYQVTPGLL